MNKPPHPPQGTHQSSNIEGASVVQAAQHAARDDRSDGPRGPIQVQIEGILRDAFQPTRLEVINESHQHAVPRGSETHFKVLIVADAFANGTRVERTRNVMARLEPLMKSAVHALSLRALSPDEESRGLAEGFISPPCAGARASENKA